MFLRWPSNQRGERYQWKGISSSDSDGMIFQYGRKNLIAIQGKVWVLIEWQQSDFHIYITHVYTYERTQW